LSGKTLNSTSVESLVLDLILYFSEVLPVLILLNLLELFNAFAPTNVVEFVIWNHNEFSDLVDSCGCLTVASRDPYFVWLAMMWSNFVFEHNFGGWVDKSTDPASPLGARRWLNGSDPFLMSVL
jgi:hypothetical protein